MLYRFAVLLAGVAALSPAPGFSQSSHSLSARELFYAPPPEAQPDRVSPKTPSRKKAPAKADIAKADNPVVPRRAPRKSVEPERPQNGAELVAVSHKPRFPLGLRYSVLKSADGVNYSETDAGTVFRSGDKLKISLQSNDTAHLYMVARGSSGTWSVLFPNPEVARGSNIVAPGRTYEMPSGGRIVFDEQPGTEKMFIVLSRRPEPNLEELIYSLSSTAQPPAVEREQAPAKQLMIAQNRTSIDDALIGKIRQEMVARDLIFEKVDESTPGARKENAVYVVNPSGDPDARLIVDLQLKHR
ncbi:MAG: DUF4384 domain-containing protein [Bryobacterales bacterium]|nr:DUF4384 domain-containing protein [Bryobacterales bacterium]